MKDYSFGDKEYQASFILNYRFEERPILFNGEILEDITRRKIILYLANGTTTELENTNENLEAVISKMKSQIERAYNELLESKNKQDIQNMQELFGYLKKNIAIKIKANDIEKNKLLLENLTFINMMLNPRSKQYIQWISTHELPIYLQDSLLWSKRKYPWDLNVADEYSLKELSQILNVAKKNYALQKKMNYTLK